MNPLLAPAFHFGVTKGAPLSQERQIKVRVSDEVYKLIEEEAAFAGATKSQFSREAIYLRAILARISRQQVGDELLESLAVVRSAIRADGGELLMVLIDEELDRLRRASE